MISELQGLDETKLKGWIESSLEQNTHILAAGYQGKTLKYEDANHQLVIKIPHGSGLIKRFHIRMLKHEYDVYQKLSGFKGAPKCFGMIDNQYLVIEFINGQPIRSARPVDEERFFRQLFEYIEAMHGCEVAHMDLKRKDNLLVVNGNEPCLIDFGAAVIRKHGFHPFNSFWYKLAQRFDYNAWIKHKYQNQFHLISDEDRPYYRKTVTEIVSRKIKRFYKDFIYNRKKQK
ncbi:MAG: hypothetical protein OQL06_01725 [Gammaproteobacteria bacterium]|nr:hypothetical protein [Gammaproteobacteria bacterium]